MPQNVLVSRCDRLGDLVLSLPVLKQLARAGFGTRVLHVSRYAKAIGEWARFNGLCEAVWAEGEAPPFVSRSPAEWVGLSLFHCPEAVKAFRRAGVKQTLGPRTRLSALWQYRKSIPQHRSRVEKSEMRYNLDLADALSVWRGHKVPDFDGLPALKVPPDWRAPMESPAEVIVVSNRGSALNWPIEKYLERARQGLAEKKSVHLLVSGADAVERAQAIESSGILKEGARLVRDFAGIEELIAYLAGAGHVLSSSTGPLHIAHAAGVPVTGLYSTVKVESFERWKPDGYWHTAPISLEIIR